MTKSLKLNVVPYKCECRWPAIVLLDVLAYHFIEIDLE